jgi:hypothetical protein
MSGSNVAAKIEENREALEELSESELPVAEIATALLEIKEGL